MELSVLFWFYKDVEVCKNKLKFLKKYNPKSKIYGLYGGPKEKEKLFKKELSDIDDFYRMPNKDPFWKWINGDLVLLDWFKKRGKNLKWDSIMVMQWDLLVLDKFENIFPGLKKGEIYLPFYEKISPWFENHWKFTSEHFDKKTPRKDPFKPYLRQTYLEFKKYVGEKYGFSERLPFTIFYLAIFPRIFFEKYSTVKNIKLGFLEYKIPTYASIFKIPKFKTNLGVKNKSKMPLNGEDVEINQEYIKKELKKTKGYRLFHPVRKIYNPI